MRIALDLDEAAPSPRMLEAMALADQAEAAEVDPLPEALKIHVYRDAGPPVRYRAERAENPAVFGQGRTLKAALRALAQRV